jgi:hypothetical protein
MSLRPADLGGVISNSSNVERISQQAQQQARVSQDVAAQQQQAKADLAQSQVQGTPAAEGTTVNEDGGGYGGGGGGKKRQSQSQEKPAEEARPGVKPRARRSARIDFKA